jgi:hypothetical protein
MVGIAAAVLVAGVVPALAAPASRPSSVTAAKQPAGHVIVLLRDQHAGLSTSKALSSPRMQANVASQAPLVSLAKSAGARNVRQFSLINGFAATVTEAQAKTLAANSAVAAIVPDLAIREAPMAPVENPAAAPNSVPVTPGDATTCPSDPSKPLLEPEALGVTNTAFSNPATPQAQNIVDGTGVRVGYIADGIDINNPDFIRANGDHVFQDYQDFSGEGPNAPSGSAEAFGDASAIAAQGRQVYDLADFVNPAHPLPAGCNITVRGVAPGATLYGLKVFGDSPTAPTSRFIQAIQYAVAVDQVSVLNESFGGNPFPDTSDDPITLADNAAIAAGVTVVSSTGDAGTTGTIGSPSSSTGGVIGVGGTTTFQSYLQTGDAGSQVSNGTWISNNISGLSSGGFTQAGGVPDLVAPGDLGWALCTPDTTTYQECTNDAGQPSSIQNFGGTSQSSPLTAGAAALVIEAYRNAHHGASPTPALVKQLLTSTATDLGHPASEQGSGLLNTLAAVQAAQSWKDANGQGTVAGNALVVNKSQLRLSGLPGMSTPTSISVRNVSATTQTVRGATRSFESTVNTLNGSAALNTATANSYVDAFGFVRSFVEVTFSVGNVDRLDFSTAAPLNGFSDRVTLLDPSGAFAAYSIPQGAANFAHVDVRFPAPGTWTAIIAVSKSSGFNGNFAYSAVQTDMTKHGSVTPSKIVLAPGQTGTFTVHTNLPKTPGDLSASVQFVSSGGAVTSVPMTLRAMIQPYHNVFSGTITGGNGRAAGGVAQSNIYTVDVPSGKKNLSIGVRFSDPNEVILGFLTAPDGQVYAFDSNLQIDSSDNESLTNSMQIYRRNPQAGHWTLSLEVTNPVSGLETVQHFQVETEYNTLHFHANLPTSTSTKLAAGVPVQVPIKVTNNGVAPETYFVDPRLTTTGTIPLTELAGNATTVLPVPPGVTPEWLVPTEVTELDGTAVGDQPVNMDFFFQSGDPDVYGAASGNTASVQVNASEVSYGVWETDIGQNGPFAGPAPSGTVTASVSAVGQLFDPAVTSSTGDVWQLGVTGGDGSSISSPACPGAGPLIVAPGASSTICVTITPSGAAGTTVHGNLYIDSISFALSQGDELAALPYAYTIK